MKVAVLKIEVVVPESIMMKGYDPVAARGNCPSERLMCLPTESTSGAS